MDFPSLGVTDAERFIEQHGYLYVNEGTMDTLSCPICHELLEDPVHCDDANSHTMCRKCIQDWFATSRSTCPVDQVENKTMNNFRDAPFLVKQMIDGQVVRCSLGCGWEGPRCDFKNHLMKYCPDVEVNSTRRGGERPPLTTADQQTTDLTGDVLDKFASLTTQLEGLQDARAEDSRLMEQTQQNFAELEDKFVQEEEATRQLVLEVQQRMIMHLNQLEASLKGAKTGLEETRSQQHAILQAQEATIKQIQQLSEAVAAQPVLDEVSNVKLRVDNLETAVEHANSGLKRHEYKLTDLDLRYQEQHERMKVGESSNQVDIANTKEKGKKKAKGCKS